MKNLIFLSLLFVTILVNAQNPEVVINFSMTGDQPIPDTATTNLKRPLIFQFNYQFDGKKIELLNNDASPKVIALKDAKFGDSNLKPSGKGKDRVFTVIIDGDGTVIPQVEGNEKITGNFKLAIEGSTPIPITFDKLSEASDSKDNPNKDYKPGYIFYDAIVLSDKETNVIVKKNILLSYGISDFNDTVSNPYLKNLINELIKKGVVHGGDEKGFGELIGNLGNTDVTYFAAGLARFLADRTKEELNEAFFNKMKEQLNAYPELKTVFPNTASYFDIIESFSYANILNALKDAFEMDIQNLPENLYNIKGLDPSVCSSAKLCSCGDKANCKKSLPCYDCKKCKCEARLTKLTEFFKTLEGQWVGLGMFTVKEAVQSSNPADLLKSICESGEFNGIKSFSTENAKYASYNVASSIELSNFISQSLMSKDDNQVWINSKELNALFATKDAFKVYLGLLLAREQSGDVIIDFYKNDSVPITFGEILKEAYKLESQYEPEIRTLIKNTYSAFNSANNAVKKMITATDKSVEADPQVLYNYYRTFTASLKPIAHSKLLDSITGKDIGAEYDKIEKRLNPSVDIAYHISTKKYSAAIYDASILLSALNEFKVTTTDKNGKEKEEKYNGFKPFTKSFVKYGTLISTVANAQSSDEVKQAIEASVLPVGSYSIKQKTKWSFSINSYVGAYWSYDDTIDYIPTFGLSAPIGFNITKGFSKTGNGGGLSLNLQIIDLGSLVNYYLINSDTASLPNDFNVRLSNIFAPGFNLCYNVPRTPLSIGWGGQYIPTLYSVEQINGKNEFAPSSEWRWQLSLLIDIPLFNLKVWDFNK